MIGASVLECGLFAGRNSNIYVKINLINLCTMAKKTQKLNIAPELDREACPEEIQVQVLAGKIEYLFEFCADLIPFLPLLEKTADGAEEKENLSLSAAPILEAVGINFEEKKAEWELRKKRAQALVNLVKVLQETEVKRLLDKQKSAEKELAKEKIQNLFGI